VKIIRSYAFDDIHLKDVPAPLVCCQRVANADDGLERANIFTIVQPAKEGHEPVDVFNACVDE